MSFLENLYKRLADGKISNEESLELEMHYYSLSEEEKNKIDSKYESAMTRVGDSQEYLRQNKSMSNTKNKNSVAGGARLKDGDTDSPVNDIDQSLINKRVLKQAFSYNSNSSYKLLIKELLIRLIPISIIILLITVFSDIPADKVPESVTSFLSIAGAIIIFYSVAVILGFLRVIFIKVFGIKLNNDKGESLE